jgi:NAD(P)-dependent dehydrogenase (short-subunit alcohol dehydrogenase family)
MKGICDGRVVIVTGAGGGIGHAHALELARQGARVVVNDLGVNVDGTGRSSELATKVVEEIAAMGGEAIANGDDVTEMEGAARLVSTALGAFGELHAVVNNAGILRDRMLFNMTEDEWDAVIRVHLRGTFCPSRQAAKYWRERSKEGAEVDARIINTTSASGIYGNPGQINYGAAKAGIAAFTVIAAQELARYGVTVNAIAPDALTRMTENLPSAAAARAIPEGQFRPRDPDNIAPLVAWLASAQSAAITGRVFNVHGGHISVAEGWIMGPKVEKRSRWDTAELGEVVPELVAKARPNANMDGEPQAEAANV